MPNPCPRCGQVVSSAEANHEHRCLEQHLFALYNLGVQRGVAGEADEMGQDDAAAAMIGRILEMAWEWRAAGRERRAETLLAGGRTRGKDLDSVVAKLIGYKDIGWLQGLPVDGEPAWNDPRVVRRRFSQRVEDALPLMEHPLLSPFELIRVHRLALGTWEWHITRKDRTGAMESLVVAPTAPLAICRGMMRAAGLAPDQAGVG